jgi:very-short-patch-repair endonuclease
MPRPYLSQSIDELEGLFEGHKHDPAFLTEVVVELRLRKSVRATNLLERILAAGLQSTTASSSQTALAEAGNVVRFAPARRVGADGGKAGLAEEELQQEQQWASDQTSRHPDAEARRIAGNFSALREKLLQLSRSNPMLNYRPLSRSRRHIAFVDESPEGVYVGLASEGKELDIVSLPEPADIPLDERNEEFETQLANLKATDIEYQAAVQGTENSARDDDFEILKLERDLRDRLRRDLGMSPRLKRKELNIVAHAKEHGIDPGYELPKSATTARGVRLQSMMLGESLQSRMGAIHDLARISEQEVGFSTLFLAFGFLEWYDAEDSTKANFAPLVLLPVCLTAHPVGGKKTYSLKATSEDATGNVTLAKKLQQFGRVLADFDPPENAGDPIGDYLESVRRAVDGLPNWKVRRFLVLGHFSFGRLAMYQDLDPAAWGDLADHPLTAGVLRGALTVEREDGAAAPRIPDDYDIDSLEIERAAPVLIHDADASQHSAIVDVMRRNNLVVSGPPGTGKSQTITNIIANALARDPETTVLFVSEKMAALEVVKHRLEIAKLGEFCLELHADKSSPKAVIESLKKRQAATTGPDASPNASRTAWQRARESINTYLVDLHAKDPGGSPAFDLIWESVELDRANGAVPQSVADVALPAGLLDDVEKQRWLLEEINEAASVAITFEERHGPLAQSPWHDLPMTAAPGQYADVLAALDRLRTALERAGQVALEAEQSGLGFEDNGWVVDVHRLPQPPNIQGIERLLAIDPTAGAAVAEVRRLREIEEGLAGDPLFQELRGERLVAAERFAALWRGSDDLSPKAVLDCARSDLADAEFRLLQVEDSRGPRHALGLDDEAPASIISAAWAAALVAAAIPDDFRAGLAWKPEADEVAFEATYAKWKTLKEADGEFVRTFGGYPSGERPNPNLLRDAASLLDEGLVSLKFWKREALANARAVAERLGIPGDAVDGLRRLADHVKRTDAFVADPANAGAAGGSWDGMATPFDRLAQTLRLRSLVREKLSPYAGGASVAARLLSLDAAALGTLAGAQSLARDRLPDSKRLCGEPAAIGVVEARAKDASGAARALLASKDADAVKGLETPLSKLRGLSRLANDREALARRIDAVPGGPPLMEVVRFSRDADLVDSQIVWIGTVRASRLPEDVRRRLLTEEAAQHRSALLDLAARVEAARRGEQAERKLAEEAFGLRLPDTRRLTLVETIDAALARRVELRDHLAVFAARRALVDNGLTAFVDAMDKMGASPLRYPAVFRQTLTRQRAQRAYRASKTLQSVSGAMLDASRRTFKAQDALKVQQDRIKLRRDLLQRRTLPGTARGRKKEWTEMALVQHEVEKQKGFLNVRALLRQAGHSVRALKPCFMMSPMTVSKFLPQDMQFDLVIIDEASQMRPEDALGALLRARQIVVVGDAQQMPPTTFFDRSMDEVELDDDDEGDEQVEESILEACSKSFDRVRHLKWHYRSRCESLIDFSNEHFYDRSLITFPMARPGSFSIDLVRVRGNYQSSVNEEEAQRVCEEAVALMEKLADVSEEEFGTMAIVAMNQKQREAIRKRLEMASGIPSVLRYMERCEARKERFDVMNLENVQGHERDYILISLTYGPGPKRTVVDQRFGPINKSQGHRRLNVLFSRARRRIGLFTSMDAKDIRPTETTKRGVHVLKAYLEYVERAGAAAGRMTGRDFDSPFERDVADRLSARGFDVHIQVGVSQYRIDLAVKHRAHPSVYVAGIECDGAAYHSSRSARDRDRLREDVLTDLGWKLLRIWSTDWFADPDQETERLVREIERLEDVPVREGDGVLFGRPRLLLDVKDDNGAREEDASGGNVRHPQPQMKDTASPPAPASDGVDLAPVTESAPETHGLALLKGNGRLSREEARHALEAFRTAIIELEMPDAARHRCILREAMIEYFLSARFDDPDDWMKRIPMYLRQGTDPAQRRFLSQICDLIARLS